MKTGAKKITAGALLLAAALLLPQAFHFSGLPNPGQIFLPMHIPVFLAGFIIGPAYGAVLGIISPVLSFLFTNMPQIQRLPFMVVELTFYGFSCGLLYNRLKDKKFGIYTSLVLSMVTGRFAFFAALVFADLFNALPKGFSAYYVIDATIAGIYGIIIQLVFIPAIVYALKRSGYIDRLHS